MNTMNITAAAAKNTCRLAALAEYRCDDQTERATLDVLPNGRYHAIYSGRNVELLNATGKSREVGNLIVVLEQGIRGMQVGTVLLSDDGVFFTAR